MVIYIYKVSDMPEGRFRVVFCDVISTSTKNNKIFFVKFVISLLAEFTSVSDPAPGFTNP